MHSELLEMLARQAENNPQLAAILQEMNQQGGPRMVIMHDVNTGKVTSSEDGGPFQPAHAAIRSMVTSAPYRNPGLVDPVTAPACEVQAMLRCLIDYYRPEFLEHPHIDEAFAATIRAMNHPSVRRKLSTLEDNYERWNRVVEGFIESMDSMIN